MKQAHRSPARVVVLGTGTGIGKTHVTQALAADPSVPSLAVKPIESGYEATDPGTDQARLGATIAAPYLLQAGVSPHLAAREAGVTIDLAVVVGWVAQLARTTVPGGGGVESTRPGGAGLPREHPSWILVESAGGVMSPLNDHEDNLDLARRLDPAAVVLVAPDRLGVLHDVRAALVAVRTLAPGLPLPMIAVSAPEQPDASTGTNAGELDRLRPGLTCVAFPRAGLSDGPTRRAAAELWNAIQLSGRCGAP